jgi:hypothetical protein
MCRAGPSWAGRWANKVKTIPRVCGLRNTAVMAEPEGMRCFQWKSWGQWESRKKLSVEKDKWSAERSWEAISQKQCVWCQGDSLPIPASVCGHTYHDAHLHQRCSIWQRLPLTDKYFLGSKPSLPCNISFLFARCLCGQHSDHLCRLMRNLMR